MGHGKKKFDESTEHKHFKGVRLVVGWTNTVQWHRKDKDQREGSSRSDETGPFPINR